MSSKSPRETPPVDLARIAAEDARLDWPALEAILRQDPAGRQLASFLRRGRPLGAGQLRTAAVHIAQHVRAVGIVTGFCVVSQGRITAETDGPPGALMLAQSLLALGANVLLISDRPALPLLEVGCDHLKLPRKILVEFPFEDGPPTSAARAGNDAAFHTETDRWIRDFFASDFGRSLTHLVSVERVGPCHTVGSLQSQPRDGAAPVEQFLREMPAEDWNLCHDMRGRSINGLTAKTHRLFEWIAEHRLPVTTIGIGDGGNEIGMGQLPWEQMVAAGGTSAGRIACRIATDFAMVAGVSNWGAYALALAIAGLRGPGQGADAWDEAQQRRLIEAMVDQAGAVDGITLRAEATVDGLPLDAYLRPLTEMRGIFGL